MNRKSGHVHAGLHRRVRADAARRSTRRTILLAAAAWPALVWTRGVFAQSRQPVLIGWLNTGSREVQSSIFTAFKDGLAALGWRDGTQVMIEERWAEARIKQLPALAEELAAKKPAVIVAATLPAVVAAAKAAPQTPIVQGNGGDLVVSGLAASLARPGGMVTGLTNVMSDISEKHLELLLVAVPKLKRGFLADSTSPNRAHLMDAARRAVARHSIDARFAEAAMPEEIEPAIARLAQEGVQALVVMPSSFFPAERRRIVKLTLAHRWPVITPSLPTVEEGALLGYAGEILATYRRAAYYVDRILKGAKPGDLPIEQPTKFEFVINMKTAKVLGIAIPQSVLLRADRVIE